MKKRGPNRTIPAFKVSLSEINADIRKAWKGRQGFPALADYTLLREVFRRDRGKCRICGIPLFSNRKVVESRPRFTFFRALKNGGKVTVDNIFCICADCKLSQRPVQRNLQRLPSGSTIADLIESLAKTVRELEVLEDNKREEHFSQNPDTSKIAELDQRWLQCKDLKDAIKRELDDSLAEMVDMMYYRPMYSSKREPVIFTEGKNTIAENVETICKDSEKEFLRHSKSEVAESIEEIVDRRKYTILPSVTEDED